MGAKVGPSKEIYNVVKIARAGPFSHRANFFGEELFKAVAAYLCGFGELIRMTVGYFAQYRRSNDMLDGTEVKLDAGRTCRVPRAAVVDPPLGRAAARTWPIFWRRDREVNS